MDCMARSLPELLGGYGLKDPAVVRCRAEICGRSYEAVCVTGTLGRSGFSQAFYCTQRDGCFLTISIALNGKTSAEEVLAELLAEPGD